MNNNPVIIFGAKSIGKAALEIFNSNKIEVFGFLDDDSKLHQTTIEDVTVFGSTDDEQYTKLIGKKCDAFIASDDNKLRTSIADMLMQDRKVMPTNAIHQNAYISKDAHIGYGNFINAGVTIAIGAKLANHCIINTSAIIEQDAVINDYAQIGAGSIIGTNCIIENEVFIGSGAIIIAGITVGKKARVGAGAVVISDVKNGETVFGNPAVAIKK